MEERNVKGSFMQGVVTLMISQAIIKIVGLIYKLYLTNKTEFGDAGNAIYSAGFQIYTIFLTVSSIGVPNAISKLVSAKVAIGDNKGAYRIFKIAFGIFGFLGFCGSTVLFFGAYNISHNCLQIPEAELTLLALAPSVFIVSITSVLRGYFNGREQISVTANSQSIEQIIKTIFTIIIVEIIGKVSNKNTVLMAAGATVATTVSNVGSLIYLYKYYIRRKKNVWTEVLSSKICKKETVGKVIKNILSISVPITLGALLSSTNKTIDAFTIVRVIKCYLGEREATIKYGILSGKIETLIALPFSFNIAFSTALVPTIASAMAKKEYYIVEKRIKFSILASILIGLPCSIIMCIFAHPILQMLFPKASEGSLMLQISSWSIIFVVLIQTINGALQGLGKTIFPVIALGIGLITKLILNLALLPIKDIGVNGAIISTFISQLTIFVIMIIYLKRQTTMRFSVNKFLIKPVVATLNMGIISYTVYKNGNLFLSKNILLIIALLIGIIVYLLSIIMLKILSKDEIYMIPYGQKVYKKLKLFKKRENR